MTPRPIHRWKSFWLGVLVLGFLGWAWWVSYGYGFFARYKQAAAGQEAGHVWLARGGGTDSDAGGYLATEYEFQLLPPPFLARGRSELFLSSIPMHGSLFLSPMAMQGPTFKEQEMWSHAFYPSDQWALFIPHWLLVTLIAVPWLAFLGWRVRRQRRSTA